jgi:DNA-binding MarR family transcriptional regulator
MQLHLIGAARAVVKLHASASKCYAGGMSRNPTEAVVNAWANMLLAQRLALASIEQALKDAALPPLAWYDALWEIERAGSAGVRPFELERRIRLAQYNLSRLLDRLKRAGYIKRAACADDRRGHVVVITASGRDLRRRMWGVYGPAIQKAVGERLSPADIKVFDRLLRTLVRQSSGSRSDARHRTHQGAS